jgi:hypothetical protein
MGEDEPLATLGAAAEPLVDLGTRGAPGPYPHPLVEPGPDVPVLCEVGLADAYLIGLSPVPAVLVDEVDALTSQQRLLRNPFRVDA